VTTVVAPRPSSNPPADCVDRVHGTDSPRLGLVVELADTADSKSPPGMSSPGALCANGFADRCSRCARAKWRFPGHWGGGDGPKRAQ